MNIHPSLFALSCGFLPACAVLSVLLGREKTKARKAKEESWKALSAQTLEAERRQRLALNVSAVVGSILQSRTMLPQILNLLSEYYAPAELRLLVYRGGETFSLILPHREDEETLELPGLLGECSLSGFLPSDGISGPLLRLSEETRSFRYNLPIIHDERFAGALVLSSAEKLSAANQGFLRDMLPSLTAALRNNRLTDRFGRAVDSRIRDHLMTGSAQPAGEIRDAGILFVDIVGFTTQAEKLPPDRIVCFLNGFFSRCQTIVSAHGGVINKFLGDGFMAIFGAPQSDPDYATNLLMTASEIIDAVPGLVLMAREYGLETLALALGADIGPVLAGTVGSDERLEYTLIGDVVNVASRLEGLTRFFSVTFLAGHSLKKAVPGWHYRALGKIRPKGKKTALNIFEVLGAPGSVDGKTLARTELFESALAKYQNRDFSGALSVWDGLASDSPDEAVEWYRTKAALYAETSPGGDWDGTEIFRSK